MAMGNSQAGYGWAAIVLHWAVVGAVVAMFYFGLAAEEAGEAQDRARRIALMGQHISLGVFVAALVLARTVWSLTQPKPAPLKQAGPFDVIARITHVALLLGLLILVISGPLAVWTGGRAIQVYDLFALPSPTGRQPELHEWAERGHAIGRFMIWIFGAVHVLGVIKHVVIDRDRTLLRMLIPQRRGASD